MLAFLSNIGAPEIVIVLVLAVLIFGKDLPQAASKAYLQVRKLRNAVDDLRRDTGIDRELRNIERTVREAEWEARKAGADAPARSSARTGDSPVPELPAAPPTPPAAPAAGTDSAGAGGQPPPPPA